MLQTKIIKLDPNDPQEEYLHKAADILREGGLVIIPTETVYGIAANRQNRRAVDKLAEIKKRPKEKVFSLHIAQKERVEDFASGIPVSAYKLIDKFWPGPLTLVLKSIDGQGSVGIRMPDDKIALRVIDLSGVDVVCPSANISGNPPPINFQEAIRDFKGLVDFAIDAGSTRVRIESSVVDFTTDPFKVLREGAIKRSDIESAAKKKTVLFICTGNSCRSVMAQAIFEKKLKDKGIKDVEVLSAGTMLFGGLGATLEVKELLAEEGMDVSKHISQKVTRDMLNKSDIILVMEHFHEERILQLDPQVKNRLFLLKEFAKAGADDNNMDISDPIGKPKEFYVRTMDTIKQAIERISEII
ncbi:MAG: L-threonylcarbamoyladenylate synthase [Candidatus Omnitrophota bacterium]|nr:threonylcarbamoyl-AMP synthase [Candidatus Omnitrophota bacterium]MBU1929344.1 threonylcarbamoyl-AMP synthase [Candidatus Omnitrophota bacterium]MBU2035636.1 threonylcarbamoyl-AMP synthase [Candidatus Omnitrophota bacterium]MBU2221450.1 threonylcarbamoyl-AMP synthase [Candidatus Omnitrophota bacterium]MBU2258840.1 threonylcarbamoyl-AMP synthase [Candidatus Omnitrophota bacterium]